ncbi:glycosyltransferase family 2 protein [Bacteroides sp. ET225]|uniref:glycosyltransferase family 2 protein n=1 Tax=Bacteroides sp. ET225 TaxID=2972461 RepID=UPI0021AD1C36|nr:glycosyltransferase family 2 protein [Bacteroides sp. ET225]MCR8916926.1 glycosyltransferase [Bacteroides sp. ET225]
MKISVIVPIYNVEYFIARCTVSLMEQTLQNVEYIFVDDCSPDNSISLLKKTIASYPDRIPNVKILSHKCNEGLPTARNTGLKVATGDYIFHCDSDDWVEKDMLAQLYEKAIEKNADIVWCDWFLSFNKNERYMKQPDYTTASASLQGMLSGSMKYNVWNKLIKRSLYEKNGIWFPEGHGMGEDMTMIRLMACAKHVAYVPKAFYHYVRLNTRAFTQAYSKRNLEDLRYNVEETIHFLEKRKGNTLQKEIAFFLLNIKLPFLITDNKKMYQLWNEWYKEANAYILKNKDLSLRLRLLQYAAAQRCYLLVWLYYKVVYKFIYGIIYK